jgi:hypothetical protein
MSFSGYRTYSNKKQHGKLYKLGQQQMFQINIPHIGATDRF